MGERSGFADSLKASPKNKSPSIRISKKRRTHPAFTSVSSHGTFGYIDTPNVADRA